MASPRRSHPLPRPRHHADIEHAEQIKTTVTEMLKIKHPVLLAGMNVAAGPKLAAAVTNAGGLGVIGGVSPAPFRPNAHLPYMMTGRLYPRHASRTDSRAQGLFE
jgi:IMP dehydrogenase/GMP reductase